MAIKEIITDLRALLVAHLGQINPGNISAITTSATINQGSTVTGLLVVVNRVPQGTAEHLTGELVYFPDRWEITLIQYDSSKSVDKALRLLETHYVTSHKVYIPPSALNKEQARIQIFIPDTTTQ